MDSSSIVLDFVLFVISAYFIYAGSKMKINQKMNVALFAGAGLDLTQCSDRKGFYNDLGNIVTILGFLLIGYILIDTVNLFTIQLVVLSKGAKFLAAAAMVWYAVSVRKIVNKYIPRRTK